MKELLVLMASVMPFEKLVSELDKATAEYKANPTKENEDKIGLNCMIVSTKIALRGTTATDFLKDLKTHQQGVDLLKPNAN